jgi:preprotein translocase subunit SecA
MLDIIKREVTEVLMTVQVRNQTEVEDIEAAPGVENVQYHHADYEEALAQADEASVAADEAPFMREGVKVGRNDPCPCGSGRKFKQCHGKLS